MAAHARERQIVRRRRSSGDRGETGRAKFSRKRTRRRGQRRRSRGRPGQPGPGRGLRTRCPPSTSADRTCSPRARASRPTRGRTGPRKGRPPAPRSAPRRRPRRDRRILESRIFLREAQVLKAAGLREEASRRAPCDPKQSANSSNFLSSPTFWGVGGRHLSWWGGSPPKHPRPAAGVARQSRLLCIETLDVQLALHVGSVC